MHKANWPLAPWIIEFDIEIEVPREDLMNYEF